MSCGICTTMPRGAVSSTCRRPDAEDDQQEVRVDAPLRLEDEGRELAERAGDDRAPERVDAADQRRREQRERVLRREAERGRLAELRCEQAAGDAGRERREREGPELVADDVHARREGRRLALADRRPRAARLRREVHGDQQEHERADDDRVAVVGGVAARDAGSADGLQARQVDRRRVAGEAVAAVREVDRRQDDVHGAGRHQRDQREVEAAQPQRRQPDQHAHDARDRAGHEQQERERHARRVRDPRRGPGADREQRDLPERDHPDAAVQRHEPCCDHARRSRRS